MSISLSGFASGIPTDQIIEQLLAIQRRPIQLLEQRKERIQSQLSVYNNIRSRVDQLKGSLTKLAENTFSSPDLFSRKQATSTNEGVVRATVTNSAAAPQSFVVEVDARATATTALSSNTIGQVATGATPVSSVFPGNVTSGDFTIFVNGNTHTVNVDAETDTMSSVMGKISTATSGAVTGSVNGSGNLVLSYSDGTAVALGSNADSTNFLDVTYLKTGMVEDSGPTHTLTSSRAMNQINLNVDMTTAGANLQTGVTAGTFKIGNATFDTAGKTLNELIGEINASEDAGVTISYNSASNKMSMVSKSTGSQLIFMEEGTSNFLSAMGLVTGGNPTLSQTAGSNSTFKINGSTYNSASNTVGPEITGMAGVTLDLLQAAPGTAVSINIENNTEDLKEAIKSFVNDYNNVMSLIDAETNAETGRLPGASNLTMFRQNLRRMVSSAVPGLSPFDSLASIGISTGPVSGTVGNTLPTLQIDEAKLNEALKNDLSNVRSLMVGSTGVLTNMTTLVEGALNQGGDPTQNGLFAAHNSSAQDRMREIDRSIERGERQLSLRELTMRRQFAAMEMAISQMQSQGQSLNSLALQF